MKGQKKHISRSKRQWQKRNIYSNSLAKTGDIFLKIPDAENSKWYDLSLKTEC
jgi:hypothetical protein